MADEAMADIVLTEGNLTFTFTNVNRAMQYDGWSHYRNQLQSACGGLKGVDFIVIEGQQLWLIEVKDYRRHPRTKPIELVDELALKVRDTMAGLLSAAVNAADSGEKKLAKKAIRCKRLRVALHLEQPTKHGKLFPKSVDPAKLLQKIRQKSGVRFADPHPKIFDKSEIPSALTSLGLAVK